MDDSSSLSAADAFPSQPVPPPRGEGSAAAALQAADSWRDILDAATLIVLPEEESIAWQRQRIHRKRRMGGAARALGRIARWLAAHDKLAQGGEREQCVGDPRFARLVAAAAAPATEGRGEGGGDASGEDKDIEHDETSLSADERTKDAADALEALRALGSLAPLPMDPPLGPIERRHVAELIRRVASDPSGVSSHDATAARWACDRLGLFTRTSSPVWDVPTVRAGETIERAVEGLPFKILPNLVPSIESSSTGRDEEKVKSEDDDSGAFTVEALAKEVPFKAEKLVTRDGKRVDERRETCWMAEDGIGGLAYSGKVMSPTPFTPTIAKLRNLIEAETGEFFDCALLNLYPEGSVACKYHRDPDLGLLWATDSVIVSVGETRRFAFRELGKKEDEAHWFRLRSGDCVWMFGNCNDDWEHCVMRAEGEVGENDGARASVVFKRALSRGGRRGHGAVGAGRRAGRKTKKAEGAKGAKGADTAVRGRGGRGGGRGGRGGGRRGGRGGRGGKGG
jgi:alkylated DNA repair dioxygenase AlkB